jgi:hypothetical protein
VFKSLALLLLKKFLKVILQREVLPYEVKKIRDRLGLVGALWVFHHQLKLKSLRTLLELSLKSPSQFGQDLFVISLFRFQPGNWAIEFGASNGLDISNTWLLEKYGWMCLLIEPGRSWKSALTRNRPESVLDFSAIVPDDRTKELFLEQHILGHSRLGSVKEQESFKDATNQYVVQCKTLSQCIKDNMLPKNLGFLSIDIEGMELAILKSIDFSEFSFEVVCVEHNFRPDRQDIWEFMIHVGYKRHFSKLSKVDDWYVKVR